MKKGVEGQNIWASLYKFALDCSCLFFAFLVDSSKRNVVESRETFSIILVLFLIVQVQTAAVEIQVVLWFIENFLEILGIKLD